MLNLMDAEVMFFDPANVGPATAELAALGFKVKILTDMVDPWTPTVFAQIGGLSQLDDLSFFNWLQTVIAPFGGDTLEAGYADAAGFNRSKTFTPSANNNQRLRSI